MVHWNVVAWSLMRKTGMGPLLLRIHPRSALRHQGWFRSFRQRSSIDRDGSPVPWWTYPAIDFLTPRVSKSLRVLEFGCGNSTRWLCQKTGEVVSVENNRDWSQRVSSQLPNNGRIVLVSSMEQFAESPLEDIGVFDIIVNDADADRIRCAKGTLRLLSKSGIVIWDNTDGPDWPEIEQLMNDHSFREISFSGMTPQEVAPSRTTIFYRADNCFDI